MLTRRLAFAFIYWVDRLYREAYNWAQRDHLCSLEETRADLYRRLLILLLSTNLFSFASRTVFLYWLLSNMHKECAHPRYGRLSPFSLHWRIPTHWNSLSLKIVDNTPALLRKKKKKNISEFTVIRHCKVLNVFRDSDKR